jgi:DNA-3-methyladenine glycosylase
MSAEYLADIGNPLAVTFFDRCVDEVAAELIGCYLFACSDEGRVGGQIIEVESYCENDPAAHSHPQAHRTRLDESKPMFSVGGRIYLYPARLHYCEEGAWCLNLTCGRAGLGSAVLIRALRPVFGCKLMRDRRKKCSNLPALGDDSKYEFSLCNGPGNLWDALGWLDDREWNGKPYSEAGLEIFSPSNKERYPVSCGSRVGIPEGNAAKEWPRSYILADATVSKYLSPGAQSKKRQPYPALALEIHELKRRCGCA